MRVLVDTSVWVDFLQGNETSAAQELHRLLAEEHDVATCGVILAELFQGIRNRRQRAELEPRLRALRYLVPTDPETYLDAATLYRRLRRRGVTVRSMVDCLIAVLAAEKEARILASDRDFDHIVGSALLPLARAGGS